MLGIILAIYNLKPSKSEKKSTVTLIVVLDNLIKKLYKYVIEVSTIDFLHLYIKNITNLNKL